MDPDVGPDFPRGCLGQRGQGSCDTLGYFSSCLWQRDGEAGKLVT